MGGGGGQKKEKDVSCGRGGISWILYKNIWKSTKKYKILNIFFTQKRFGKRDGTYIWE